MTKRSLASLCIKLMAVYLIAANMPLMPNSLYMIYLSVSASDFWISLSIGTITVIIPIVWLGLGMSIIHYADVIARKLVPEDEDTAAISMSGEDVLYRVFIVCLGMMLTFQTLPQIVQIASQLYMADGFGFVYEQIFFTPLVSDIAPIAAQLAIGVFLVVRPDIVSGLVKKCRFHEEDSSDDCDGLEQG